MDDYLTKPIRPPELAAAIERAPLRTRPGAATAEEPSEPIDRAVVARLTESMGGDEGFVAELIDQFAVDAPGLVAAARAGLEAGDAGEVYRAAHTLKSNAATFGANELVDRSRRLEQAAKEGSLDDGADRLAEIEDALDRAVAALHPGDA
jgi:HPt (histidine-containing phosphotransfer) domain-containing protein